ncbi:hypothetical protein J3D57_002042 [Bacillus amyloliquefaciens]|nr:hypothetical protein [Bacillus amyloliquefaciens]
MKSSFEQVGILSKKQLLMKQTVQKLSIPSLLTKTNRKNEA